MGIVQQRQKQKTFGATLFNILYNWYTNSTVVILTDPAENVRKGKKIIPNRVSGYWVQTYPRTAIIAPDCKVKTQHFNYV